jgi:class 3 adenylate cyclase
MNGAATPTPSTGPPPAGQPSRQQLSKIRHDLRTPLNHVIGFSEMLLEEVGEAAPAEFLRDLRKIQSGGKELVSLINEVFDETNFSASGARRSEIDFELRTAASHIIGYAELLTERAAEQSSLAQCVPDLEKIRRAAAVWLELMAKYLSPLGATGEASAASLAPEATPGPHHDTDTSLGAVPAASPTLAPGESGFLLVADDDPGNRDMLARRLQRAGYQVALAENGRQALELVRAAKFDLVLLDLIMPDLDGLQVLQQMKADPALRHVPVIMLSALDDEQGIARCIEAGASDYVAKPFNPVFLRARIRAELERKRLRDQEQVYLRQIQLEQENSERLLLNVLPKAIADRLKHGESGIVDSFPEVTVLFADLADFTELSARLPAAHLVRLLNGIFSALDELARRHGLEKIKTIGDAYLAVAGVPVPRPDHAEAVADFALAAREALEAFNREHDSTLSMRIGIHTGPVIAGIIGTDKFAYDLWGDTVNTASRMESHGQPGAIQVSDVTCERLKHRYELVERGAIEVKGKGQMLTHLLLGKKT